MTYDEIGGALRAAGFELWAQPQPGADVSGFRVFDHGFTVYAHVERYDDTLSVEITDAAPDDDDPPTDNDLRFVVTGVEPARFASVVRAVMSYWAD